MSDNYNDEKIKTILESEKVPESLEPENIKKFLDDTNAAGKRKRIKHSRRMRIVSAAAAFAVVVGTSAYFARPALQSSKLMKDANTVSAVESMKPAVEYKDIYTYFRAASNAKKLKNFISGIFGNNKYANDVYYTPAEEFNDDDEAYGALEQGAESYAENAEAPAAVNGAADEEDDRSMTADKTNSGVSSYESSDSSNKKDYSDTYNQEEGVLEADIVKTDGKHIFYAVNDTVRMAETDRGKFKTSGSTDIFELLGFSKDEYYGSIKDMYIYNDKLVLICGITDNGKMTDSVYGYGYYSSSEDTYVLIVSTGGGLKLDGYFIQDGNYSDVRLMANGYMYLVTNCTKYLDFRNTTADDVEEYVPCYGVCGEMECVAAEDVLIPTEKLKEVYDYVSYMNFSGLDLNSKEPWNPADMKSVAGYSNTVYCSQKNLYVVSGYDETEITRFSLSDGIITPEVSGKVNGYVNDQFSMSEYKGYFRIAVTENVWEERRDIAAEDSSVVSNQMISRKNTVNVLDMDLKLVGSISDFGLNENIKSVNFSGDTAYVVTFRNTDPLYAIDLSDPANPKMLDELKISGYSSYMQNWGDGLLLGFGAEADESTGGQTGVKLTMFDNSDPENLKVIDSVSFTDDYSESIYYHSAGINERKALYIDPERNIIGFPVTSEYLAQRPVFSETAYKFYSFDNGKLVYKGQLSVNIPLDYEYNGGFITDGFSRAVYIDGYIYAVSANIFKSADTVNFKETDSLTFDEKIKYNNYNDYNIGWID